MLPDFLTETDQPVDSVTLERAVFRYKFFRWRESARKFTARYCLDEDGQMVSEEYPDTSVVYARDQEGRQSAAYRLDAAGSVTERELWERDAQDRLIRRVIHSVGQGGRSGPPSEQIIICEYDETGLIMAERSGSRLKIEKRKSDNHIEQICLYDDDRVSLITDYSYDDADRLISSMVRSAEGRVHRRTDYAYDAAGRMISEIIRDGKRRVIKDAEYIYPVPDETGWLKRITLIPDGRGRNKRRPLEAYHRSFTYKPERMRTAFQNGVYTGTLHEKLPEGRGLFRYNDGSSYEGDFRGGVMDGHGRLTWPDGRIMEGDFKNGALNGSGSCLWPDGSQYTGTFQNGTMHGDGEFVSAGGKRFRGTFENGQMIQPEEPE